MILGVISHMHNIAYLEIHKRARKEKFGFA